MVSIDSGDQIKIKTDYVVAILDVDKVHSNRVYFTVSASEYYHEYEDMKYENIAYIDKNIVEKGDNITVRKDNKQN